MFQREGGDRMGIQYLEGDFHGALRDLQERQVGLTPEGFDVRENMSFRRSLNRGSTPEVANRGLDTEAIEAKN